MMTIQLATFSLTCCTHYITYIYTDHRLLMAMETPRSRSGVRAVIDQARLVFAVIALKSGFKKLTTTTCKISGIVQRRGVCIRTL